MALSNEPSLIGGVGTGASLAILIDPLKDIALEMGASERLSSALVKIFIFIAPVLVGLIVRSRTVSKGTHEETVEAALKLPPGATETDLRRSMGIKAVS